MSFGLNLNLTSEEIGALAVDSGVTRGDATEFFVWPPSSLRAEIGNSALHFDADIVREMLARDLSFTLREFSENGYEAFSPLINEILLQKNEEVSFAPHGRERCERVRGILRGLDADGWIMVEERETKQVQKYCSGELCRD